MSTSKGCYIGRPLLNHQRLAAWCAAHGFPMAPSPHVTLCHSTTPVESSVRDDDYEAQWNLTVYPNEFTHIGPLGDKGAIVLHLSSADLHRRYEALRAAGAVSSYEGGYKPHITLTYEGDGVDWRRVPLPDFALEFGAERTGPLDGDVFAKMAPLPDAEVAALVAKQTNLAAQLEARTPHIIAALRNGMSADTMAKAADQQLVMGWANVVTDKDGLVIVDRQRDVIRMDTLAKAARDYFATSAVGGVVHMRVPAAHGGTEPVRIGKAIEGLIVTPLVKAVLGLPADTPHGFAITMHVESPAAWKAVRAGTFKMFSIGGRGVRTPVALPKHITSPRSA